MNCYKIVCHTDTMLLERAVSEMMRDGWVPQGSMVVVNKFVLTYCQPMVYNSPKNDCTGPR